MAREKGHDGRGVGGIRPKEAASTITGGRASADRTCRAIAPPQRIHGRIRGGVGRRLSIGSSPYHIFRRPPDLRRHTSNGLWSYQKNAASGGSCRRPPYPRHLCETAEFAWRVSLQVLYDPMDSGMPPMSDVYVGQRRGVPVTEPRYERVKTCGIGQSRENPAV